MHAYNESYLCDARETLGDMFDYAINIHGMDPDEFWDLFAYSRLSNCLSHGDPKYIAGMSGPELFGQLIYESRQKWIDLKDVIDFDRSRQYWAGYALANYQWESGMTYAAIRNRGIMLSDIISMYILHEAPDEKFIEVMNERIRENHTSALKRIRAYAGLTQKQLSDRSGVTLRMIQLYEQGQNDLSKAQAGVVMSLANTLGCNIEELLMSP